MLQSSLKNKDRTERSEGKAFSFSAGPMEVREPRSFGASNLLTPRHAFSLPAGPMEVRPTDPPRGEERQDNLLTPNE